MPAPLLVGPVVGVVGSAGFGVLCLGLYWVMTGRVAAPGAVVWFGVSGAVAGMLLGICGTIDRVLWNRDKKRSHLTEDNGKGRNLRIFPPYFSKISRFGPDRIPANSDPDSRLQRLAGESPRL